MIFSLAVSLALAASGPVPGPGLLSTWEDTLPNGLRVLVHPWPEAPVVAIRLLLPVGAAGDPPGRSGLAHLVEHLSFEGSEHAPGNAYDRLLSAVGATSDAATSHDRMVSSVTLPAGALPLALFLEGDRLAWLAPTGEALANQKEVVANERAESARADQVRRALAPLLWPEGHPYARPVIGDPAELGRVTLAEVMAFVGHAFQADGATLVIVGPVDAAATLDAARHWCGEGARQLTPPPSLPGGGNGGEGPLAASVRAWVPADVDRIRLRLGWRTFDRTHPDRVALELAGALLQEALRGDGAQVNAWAGRQGGELTVAVDVVRVGGVLRRIEAALSRLARAGPEEGELLRIRAMARSRELRGLQTAEGRAAVLIDCADRTGIADCLPAEWAAREEVDAEAIRAVVARWLAPGSRVLLAVAPWSRRRAPLPRMTLLDGSRLSDAP
ncbi:MAG: pitrilysin family protein [Pseudomonadota bacterium]|nr:pitrilysin family protein [Pseudomonadota bacterium]